MPGGLTLIADALACRRGGRLVLDGVSFALGPGEALAVTGRNGAGKSTLLAALAGLVPLEGGSVRVEGAGERVPAECLHVVAHRDALKASLTAAENLAFAAALLGEARLPPDAALAQVGLAGAGPLPVATLSAGQRRRVALARLLVCHRPVWLLDEPLTALDAAGQALLGGLVAGHLAAGGLVVAATHADLATHPDLPAASIRTLRLGSAA